MPILLVMPLGYRYFSGSENLCHENAASIILPKVLNLQIPEEFNFIQGAF